MLSITRYAIRNPALQLWVKFIWYLETEEPVTVNHKLLPSDCIDIILNLLKHGKQAAKSSFPHTGEKGEFLF